MCCQKTACGQYFSFWYSTVNVSKQAPWGGWWGFGTVHTADLAETIYWKISISDKSVHILKLQSCQYHKVYFCHTKDLAVQSVRRFVILFFLGNVFLCL